MREVATLQKAGREQQQMLRDFERQAEQAGTSTIAGQGGHVRQGGGGGGGMHGGGYPDSAYPAIAQQGNVTEQDHRPQAGRACMCAHMRSSMLVCEALSAP